MWSINSEELECAKEELKGRRAAIEAKYATELKALDSDASEIETLARVAAAFAMKRRPEDPVPPPAPEPVAEPEPELAPSVLAAAAAAPAVAAVAEPPHAAAEPRSTSRWRLRLGDSQADRD